jgi:hypothetical protein
MEKMEMGMKGKEEEGTRKWDDMEPVPINLWANGVMKYCMNEGTSVLQSTTLDGYMVERASFPHSTFGMKELVDTFIIWVYT